MDNEKGEKSGFGEDDHQVHDAVPLSKDGIKLHPQPTSDPLDPLNWSSFKKHSILAIVMALYFMFTYITTTTVPSFPELQEQYNISIELVNWTVAIPALGLAIGPLLWSSPADIIGRRIIFLCGTAIAFAATIGAAKATTYGGYMAARLFQGLGVSPAATVGLAIINDLFFEHERGTKIGLWVLAIDVGLYFGPLIGGFMDLVSAAWIQWLTAILFAAIFIAELFFLPETLYPRNVMLMQMPYAEGGSSSTLGGGIVDIEKTPRRASVATDVELPRTKTLAFVNVKPVPGLRHPKVWDSAVRFGLLWKFWVVPLSVFVFCFGWYWWILTLITMIPVAYANYSPQIQGLFFIGLIVGTLFTEVFCSGRLSDWLVLKLAKKNGGVKVAEMRLLLAYPAATISAIGLIIWGISIDKNYHWIVGQISFFLFGAGIQMGNTAICSYIVDAYPLQAMSIVTFYSVLLNLSAFISPFFISPWVTDMGYTWSFAIQGMLTFFFCVPCIALVQKFGPGIRQRNGQPGWLNPEYDTI
ncbi:major facilitator superfamily transporter [Tothia fuscella]|uniref:Major facilitator superfamily transporter n=1 Tax=Tothia fuscella TaxID=1048955 RepID=A0A9P4TZT7_9PEZI|nr:major facilitator superfamily transporter [Tothia fuscella]